MSSKRSQSAREGRSRSKTSRSARTGSPDVVGLTSLSDTKRRLRLRLRGKWVRSLATNSVRKGESLLDRIHANKAAKLSASLKLSRRVSSRDASRQTAPQIAEKLKKADSMIRQGALSECGLGLSRVRDRRVHVTGPHFQSWPIGCMGPWPRPSAKIICQT